MGGVGHDAAAIDLDSGSPHAHQRSNAGTRSRRGRSLDRCNRNRDRRGGHRWLPSPARATACLSPGGLATQSASESTHPPRVGRSLHADERASRERDVHRWLDREKLARLPLISHARSQSTALNTSMFPKSCSPDASVAAGTWERCSRQRLALATVSVARL